MASAGESIYGQSELGPPSTLQELSIHEEPSRWLHEAERARWLANVMGGGTGQARRRADDEDEGYEGVVQQVDDDRQSRA